MLNIPAMLVNAFLKLPRYGKRLLMACTDSFLLVFGLWLAFSLRLDEWYWPPEEMAILFFMAPLIGIPLFIRFGLYRAIIRYLGFHALWGILKAVSLYSLLWALFVLVSGVPGVPRSVLLINWFLVMLFIGGGRMIARWSLSESTSGKVNNKNKNVKNVVIYGTGSAGIQLATALSYGSELNPVAFIDDDQSMHNHYVQGLKVYLPQELPVLVEELSVQEVLLAIPSVSRSRKKEIIDLLEPLPIYVRTLPGVTELAQGKVKVDDLRDLEIDELLGREPVVSDETLLNSCIKGKSIMVTGAGGSIGSELCRQIIRRSPTHLVLFEISEFSLYSIRQELIALRKEKGFDVEIYPVLGSVCNKNRLKECCEKYGVQTVYHAAAYKHVPIIEENPCEGIRNNVLGTLIATQVALELSIEEFVLISTDKAVRPTNVMGATKRFAELILQAMHFENPPHPPFKEKRGELEIPLNSHAEPKGWTKFCMVRFGNVLGSSGSVVPYFKKQIQQGGPVTVTHKEITRYFMSISEASQLVIQAGAMAEGGDVFLLDMGEPVKIDDLARHMIRLSGLDVKDEKNQNGDVEITYTGLRSGEKLYEELLIDDQALKTTHPRIMRAKEKTVSWEILSEAINQFRDESLLLDKKKIKGVLKSVVEEYEPSE